MPRYSRNVPRETPLLARVCDALATAYLVAFASVCLAGLSVHPLAVPACALLGGIAMIWILR